MVITKFHKPIVSVEWLYQNLNATNLIILDATIPKVSESSKVTNDLCIPNARFFDLKNKLSDTTAKFPNTFPSKSLFEQETRSLGINTNSFLVVYDNKGIYSSPRAWYLFKAFGFNNVAVLDGGLPAWIEAYYPLAKKEKYNDGFGNFIAVESLDKMTFFDNMKVVTEQNSSQIIDARSEARFNSLETEPREGLRSGTIPNSKNLPFTNLLNNGRMKSEIEIKNIFEEVISNNKPLVFSCGSGITACVLALGATLVACNSISVYDGSWTEWGTLMPE